MAVARIRDIRRRELLEAALEIIKREGLPATTLSRIADEAGVSKGIVHHYFTGKDELIEESFQDAHSRRRDDLFSDCETPALHRSGCRRSSVILDE